MPTCWRRWVRNTWCVVYCLLNYKYNHPSSLARRESTNTNSFLISEKPQDFPTVWSQRGEKEKRWESLKIISSIMFVLYFCMSIHQAMIILQFSCLKKNPSNHKRTPDTTMKHWNSVSGIQERYVLLTFVFGSECRVLLVSVPSQVKKKKKKFNFKRLRGAAMFWICTEEIALTVDDDTQTPYCMLWLEAFIPVLYLTASVLSPCSPWG